MSKKFYLVLLCLANLVISCGNNNGWENGKTPVFAETQKLEGKQIFKDKPGILYITDIDSVLILSTIRDSLFHIYDKKQNFITRFGKKGRGPNEFITLPFIYDATKSEGNIYGFAYDSRLIQLVKINISASIDSSRLLFEQQYDLPKELRGTFEPFHVNNESIIGIYDDRSAKQIDELRGWYYYDIITESLQTFPFNNLSVEPNEIMPATNINARVSAISPNRDIFVSAMMYYPQFDIINVDSLTKTEIITEDSPPPKTFELENFKKGEITEYYSSLDVTNDHIYLLKSNVLDKNRDNPHQTEIHMFDHNGKPKMKYLVPARYSLKMILVDDLRGILYGIDDAKDAVYKFKL